MRMLGGWIALTPELDAKLLFGRHVWDCAQHADLWGRRLPELRAPAQQSEPANDRRRRAARPGADGRGADARRSSGSPPSTACSSPTWPRCTSGTWRCANPVYEPPTRRILDRCLDGGAAARRRRRAGARPAHRRRPGAGRRGRRRGSAGCSRRSRRAGGVTGDVEAPLIVPPALVPDPAVVAQDLVALPPAFEPARRARRSRRAARGASPRARPRRSRAPCAADLAPGCPGRRWPPRTRGCRRRSSAMRGRRLRAAGPSPRGQAAAAGTRGRRSCCRSAGSPPTGRLARSLPSRPRAPQPTP